ncbi:MAG: [FeFe] hydrogenase H-cluster radical SAM maturase HydE [Firmicutes bacterium]|nr:[FeFe] hydrogenase H-cluster radical SAM maturase HydE [Bacillota bacterium]
MSDTANYLSFNEALQEGLKGSKPERRWLVPLLDCNEDDAQELYKAADKVRDAHIGPGIHLRALIEFSNYCKKNCFYCGLRRDNKDVERYRMSPDEILDAVRDAYRLGYRTVVMQSGEDPWFTEDRLADIIRRIKAEFDIAITISIGERNEETYRVWKEAGADRSLVRIETTNPELFKKFHPDDDLQERMECLRNLKKLGYQLGSGVLVGLPGQTPEMLADDVIWLHELGAEMIGVGPFIPHPGTPLKDNTGGTVEKTLRLVAVLRLVFPFAHLPATTAMGSLHPLGREKALKAGANVMMPNVTPIKYRADYEIYPGKICTGDDAAHCRGCITGRIEAIGRTIADGKGDVIRKNTP